MTDPIATSLPGGFVLLGPSGTRLFLRSLLVAERDGRRDGIRAPSEVTRLCALLAATLGVNPPASPTGSAEVPPSADQRRSRRSLSSSTVLVDPVGTVEAAKMLDCTSRNVRDLCERGVFATAAVRVGRWVMERDEVVARVGESAGCR